MSQKLEFIFIDLFLLEITIDNLINISSHKKRTLLIKTVLFFTGSLLKIYPNLPEVDAITNAPKVTKFPTVKWVKPTNRAWTIDSATGLISPAN